MNYIIKCKNKEDIKYIAYILAKTTTSKISDIINEIVSFWRRYGEYTYIWIDDMLYTSYSDEIFVKALLDIRMLNEKFSQDMDNIKIRYNGKTYYMAKNPFVFYQKLKRLK